MKRRLLVAVLALVAVVAVAGTWWLLRPTSDWQQVDDPSGGGTQLVRVEGVDSSNDRFQPGESVVAVLQVEPKNALVRPGFMSGFHAAAFRYAHEMPNGMYRMGVGTDDVIFFALPKKRGDQPVGLRLVEVTTRDDQRYTHVPLY
ncbi:hypothetical protein CYG49_01790 [Candidatus Saccharibacteria bacterium]|nr:MAG: hypothetical protein CYG49_01790 [Candidatus Saccharibacteria bacterium]